MLLVQVDWVYEIEPTKLSLVYPYDRWDRFEKENYRRDAGKRSMELEVVVVGKPIQPHWFDEVKRYIWFLNTGPSAHKFPVVYELIIKNEKVPVDKQDVLINVNFEAGLLQSGGKKFKIIYDKAKAQEGYVAADNISFGVDVGDFSEFISAIKKGNKTSWGPDHDVRSYKIFIPYNTTTYIPKEKARFKKGELMAEDLQEYSNSGAFEINVRAKMKVSGLGMDLLGSALKSLLSGFLNR